MSHFTSNYYYTLKITCVSCILACSYSLSHPFSLTITDYTCRRVKWGEHGTYKTLATLPQQQQPQLNPGKSFSIKEPWVEIYSNQKAINYISPSIEPMLKLARPKLHNLLQFSPPSIPDILWASPPNFARFCDTRISSLIFYTLKLTLHSAVYIHQVFTKKESQLSLRSEYHNWHLWEL